MDLIKVSADVPAGIMAAAFNAGASETRSFGAEVLLKRTGNWVGGKAILVDRKPCGQRTEFKHCLNRHTVALHLEGANTRAALRYDGGSPVMGGGTLGQVMLIPAEHQLEGWSDYPAKIRHVVLLLDPEIIDNAAQEEGCKNLALPFYRDLDDGAIAMQLRALQMELDHPGLLGRLYIESLSCEIAIRIARKYSARPAALKRGGLSPRRLRMVQDYIEANLQHEITLADLAEIAGVSTAHFCRAFHKSAGVASHQYIIRRRVELAKTMLAEGELPIAEIALAVGFGNQSHLTKHFHRLVGTTPWRFRNEA